MLKFIAAGLVLGLAGAAIMPAAWAQGAKPTPATFGTGSAQAQKIAGQVYAGTIRAEPKGAGRIETALIDLHHDGVAQIAVRFDYPDLCDKAKTSCFTTVIAYEKGGWQQVFAQRVATLAVAPAPKGAPADLVADGDVWQPVAGHYVPRIADHVAGKPMAPDHATSGKLAAALTKALGKGAMIATRFDDGNLGTVYAVQGAGATTAMTPMPFFLWSAKDGVILRTQSHGLFGLGRNDHDGVQDIVVAVRRGLDFYRWSARDGRYTKYRTSYVSSLSPAP